MGEIVNIFLGQSGVQIGQSFWSLISDEHKIDQYGKKLESDQGFNGIIEQINPFFQEGSYNNYIPRSVFVDLDPTTIDEIRKGNQRQLFSSNQLISGKEDAASNFSRGAYTVGKELIDVVMYQICKEAEKCDRIQGFMIYGSIIGGTSSGFNDLLLSRIRKDYDSKLQIINNTIIPSNGYSSTMVEPYNCVLGYNSLIEFSNMGIFFQNQAMYNIFSNKLDIENPNFADINRLIAQIISSYTSSIRFRGELNFSLSDLITNLIPYHRISYLIPSYSPFMNSNSEIQIENVKQITRTIFENEYSLVDCNFRKNQYMACSYMLRGDVIPKDVVESIHAEKSKKTIKFVDWIPTGFKLGVNSIKPQPLIKGDAFSPKIDGCLLSNSSVMYDVLYKINHKFDIMYAYRAYTFWYVGEGIDEGMFSESRENLAALEKDYESALPMEEYYDFDEEY